MEKFINSKGRINHMQSLGSVALQALKRVIVPGIFVLVFMATGSPAEAQSQLPPPCSCYFSVDCIASGRGDYCDYTGDCVGGGECMCVVKPNIVLPAVPAFQAQFPNGVLLCNENPGDPRCDGVCKGQRTAGATWGNVPPEKVSLTVDLLMKAYIKAAKNGGGFPDEELLAKAKSAAAALPVEWRKELLNGVHTTLVTLLGGVDFLVPISTVFGQVPSLGDSGCLLLTMTKDAMVKAIIEGKPFLIEDALKDFWDNNDYEPRHAVHCFPHGHDEAPDVAKCMAGQITGVISVILKGREDLPGSGD
jgi:hypothetical protein